MNINMLSDGAKTLLKEIVDNENNKNYWKDQFVNLQRRDKSLLRIYFKELSDDGMVNTIWADNYPYIVQVEGKGYICAEQLKEQQEISMSKFECELKELIDRAKNIQAPVNAVSIGVNMNERNRPSNEWINDVEIFYNKYLKKHPLGDRIKSILFHRNISAFDNLRDCLVSISNDTDFIASMNGVTIKNVPNYQAKIIPEYDVFLSHANADKKEIVEELNRSLELLGVKIFYDKKALEWGDKWKDRILDGIKKAEFAIIVISENFFDREWTEIELNELLNRQNRNGQKLILPILHHITIEDLRKKYSLVADIQAIDSNNYTCDQIALLFARQLIKRLRNI